jgi:hypothetical protein
MSEPTHCPYCITGGFGFEMMVRNTSDEYVCLKCGHVCYPHSPWLHCSCERCRMACLDVAKPKPNQSWR